MDDELIGELRESAARDAQAYARLKAVTDAAPEATETADEREVVMVRMGGDGLPEQIFFAADWREYCPAGQLATAVMDAAARAAESFAVAWRDALSGQETRAAAAVPPPEDDPVEPSPHPRRLDELAEDVIAQLHAAVTASRNLNPEPVEAVGEDRSRRVRLTLSSAGMTHCQIDPGWARSQPATRLGQAFQQALRDGRRRMKKNAAPVGRRTQQTDRVFGEVMAYLSDPRLLRGS